ncbi:MAG: type II/IV secretion system ATPase subunit [Nitrososphaeria archaeon]|nr:type II/IV secretion system ATPase subunit [Nitrososphaeria archaeon]
MTFGDNVAFKATYVIQEPFVYSAVVEDPVTKELIYRIIEPTITPEEKEALERIKKILFQEVEIDLEQIDSGKAPEILEKETRRIIKEYKMKIDEPGFAKLFYYIKRDFLGFERIDPMMRDHFIEDISCDGVGIPIYVWHREWESIPSNISFDTEEDLNRMVVRLAYRCGRHISIGNPILDGSLPDGSRVNATYGAEISKKGATFTIRRFRADPLTIVDMISLKTVSPDLAALLWFAVENKSSVLVAGGVASGKTTLLNCISMFIRPDLKIVTIEETPELNLPHINWIPMTTRTGFGKKEADVSLFDLLKNSLRQRPDYIIVGEVRGKEAYTLFQALATGHGVQATIHADSPASVFKRLEAEPMNVPRPLIGLIDLIIMQNRTRIGDKPARRTVDVTEVGGYDPDTDRLVINQLGKWDPRSDTFNLSGESLVLKKISERRGISIEEIQNEISRRKTIFRWMEKRGMRRYQEIGNILREFYADPERIFRRAMVESV